MAYDHEAVIRAQYERLAAERTQALADYEAGRMSEDGDSTMMAADRILDVDQKRAALDRIAQTYVTSQQQPQGNRFGLSPTEVEVAHNSYSGGSKEEKERSYVENRAKLRHLRATGQYSDSPGSVSR
jgi:hypothetical protein